MKVEIVEIVLNNVYLKTYNKLVICLGIKHLNISDSLLADMTDITLHKNGFAYHCQFRNKTLL